MSKSIVEYIEESAQCGDTILFRKAAPAESRNPELDSEKNSKITKPEKTPKIPKVKKSKNTMLAGK